MNIRRLRAFKTVIDHGSITRAADIFNISQPAMSNMIAALEDDVGFALFERVQGRVRPTPEALRLYEEAEKALSGFEKVIRSAGDIRDLRAGELRIASMPGPSLGFLPRVVALFNARYPDVVVSLQTRSSPQVKDWIEAQLFDIGLAELPVDTSAIEVTPLQLRCVCAFPADHPLRLKRVVKPQDLAPYPFIALSPDNMTHGMLRDAFESAGLPWRPRIECQLFAPACNMVARGVGVTVLDPFTAEDFADRGIVTRPFKPEVTLDIGILYPASRPRSRVTRAFAAILDREVSRFV